VYGPVCTVWWEKKLWAAEFLHPPSLLFHSTLNKYEYFLSLLSSLLGILLMALSGLRTLTVLIAERFSFSTSRQYSRALKQKVKIQPRNWQYSRALKQKVKFSLAMGSFPGPL
jgi:hypothetical protein